MNKNELNTKIAIQILCIIVAVMVFILAIVGIIFTSNNSITESIYYHDYTTYYNYTKTMQRAGFYYYDYSWIIYSIIMTLSILWFIVSIIKIKMYSVKKSELTIQNKEKHSSIQGDNNTKSLTAIKQRLAYLQNMKNDKLITEEEYQAMRNAELNNGELL